MTCGRRKKAEEINANGIRAKMCDVISEEFKRLIKEQIDPWIFFNSKGIRAKRFVGKDISISGVTFEGSSRLVFWQGYIEPFIEDIIKKKLEETVFLANAKKVAVPAVLSSTKANLSGGINTVYHKMQDIDRRLRGKGYPESVPKRDISSEIKKMNDFLDRQTKTYEDLTFQVPESGLKRWHQENPHWVWIIPIIIAIIAIIISVFLNQNKEPSISYKDNVRHQEVNGQHITNYDIENQNNFYIVVKGKANMTGNGKIDEMSIINGDGETDPENGTFRFIVPSFGNVEVRMASNTLIDISAEVKKID